MKTITLTAELAQDLRSGEAPPECGYKVVADYEIGEARWAVIRVLVIEDADGRFFAGTYRSGTGDNGEMPWERDDTAEFTEVIARQKVTTEYVSADKVPAPEPEPDPSDPRQIAVTLMLDAARELDTSNTWDAIAEQHPNMSDLEIGRLVQKISKLAETADITIAWAEVSE